MSAEREREPFNDPALLLDELNAVISEQRLLALRTQALQARYRELQPHAARFDKPGPDEWSPPEMFGLVEVESAVIRLGHAAEYMEILGNWLGMAVEAAARVREYPQAGWGR